MSNLQCLCVQYYLHPHPTHTPHITHTPPTHRLMMLPVQWYAQRQRSESHNSNDQYQDALEDQSDNKPRPLSLTMAGVLAMSFQNHKKSPTTNYGSLDAPKIQDTTVKSEERSQDTTVESQDTAMETQDTMTEPDTTTEHDTTIEPTVEPQDTTMESQDTTVEPQDTTVESQDTTVESQDTTVKSQDTTVEPQDTTVEITVDCRDNFEAVANSNYATTMDGTQLVDNNNLATNQNTSLDNSEGRFVYSAHQ